LVRSPPSHSTCIGSLESMVTAAEHQPIAPEDGGKLLQPSLVRGPRKEAEENFASRKISAGKGTEKLHQGGKNRRGRTFLPEPAPCPGEERKTNNFWGSSLTTAGLDGGRGRALLTSSWGSGKNLKMGKKS